MTLGPFTELVAQEVLNQELRKLEEKLVDLLREKDERIAVLTALLNEKENNNDIPA